MHIYQRQECDDVYKSYLTNISLIHELNILSSLYAEFSTSSNKYTFDRYATMPQEQFH